MLRISCILAILAFTTACAGQGAERAQGVGKGGGLREALRVRAMTFNIRVPVDEGERSWERRRAVAAAVLGSRKPDLVGFQEMVPRQRDDLLADSGAYEAVGSGREKDRGGESCSLFFLKERWALDAGQTGTFWYSDHPELPGSNEWQAKWIRICTWARLLDKASGRGIYVYNSHWDFSEDFHLRAAGLLSSRMEQRAQRSEPVIVMGDLNASPDDKGLRWLLEGGRPLPLEDVWRTAHPGEDGFSSHDFSGVGKERIDYLLGPKGGFKVLEVEVVHDHDGAVWPSDHFPVCAELDLY